MGSFPYSSINTGRDMRIRYNGLYDFDTILAAIIDWGKNYGYKVNEKAYNHKVPSPKGAEQKLEIIFTKNVDDFVRYTINVNIHTWDMLEVNVEVAGRKKQLTNSRIEIKLSYTINMDWQRKFSTKNSKLIDWMSWAYVKIMGSYLESTHVDGLHYRTMNLQNMIKRYFDMQAKAHPYKGYLGEN